MADNTDDLIISISTDQATLRRSIQRIERDLAGLAGGVQRQFAAVGKSIDNSVSTTLQNRINSMVGIGTKAANEWTGALADQGKELERLRARYSPLFATINNYKAAVADIRRAHAVGAISANEMTAAIQRERQAALASTAAIKGRNTAIQATVTRSGIGGNANAFQTANIAAQFQDIAVTSAMGMNPLQIALQQGTQLSSVFATMGNGRGVVTGLAAAFRSLISVQSLLTIGLVAGGAAAIQYFSSLAAGSKKSDEELKEHAQLVQGLAEKWGNIIPALREYANELSRAQDAADIRQGTSIVNERTLEGVKKGIEDARATYAAFVADLRLGGEDPEIIKKFEDAFQQFTKAANEGKLEAADVTRVQDALAAALNSTGIPAITEFKKVFDEISKSAEAAATSVEKNNESLRNIPKQAWRSFNPQTGDLETNPNPWDGNIQNPGFMTPEIGPVPERRPQIELEGLPGAQKKAETAAEKARKAYEDLKKSADDRIGQIQQEIGLLGKYGAEADAARFELDLLQRSEDKGRSLSPEQRKEIEQKVALYRQYSDTLAKTKLQQDLINEARFNSLSKEDQQITATLRQYGLSEDLNSAQAGQIRKSLRTEELRDEVRSFAGDFKEALLHNGGDIGKAFAESIQNALLEEESKLWDKIFDQIINGLIPSSSPGATGGASGLGAVVSAVGSGSSGGGSVSSSGSAVDLASKLIGQNENTNTGSINSFLKRGGVDINAAQTAWCAAFVNSSLEQIGVKGSGSLTANSFLNWGTSVDPSKVLRGDVLVQSRGLGANQVGGHVGFATGAMRVSDGQTQLQMLSGNSANSVQATWVNALDVQARRATDAASALGKVANNAGAAGQGLGQLGQSLGGIQLSPGSGSAVGGYGGLWGGIGKFFGGISPTSPLWAPNTTFGAFLGLANGGHVTGPGGPTDDSVPAFLSNGEFVVNAAATKKHRKLLDALNSGRAARFASGGIVSPRLVSAPTAPSLQPSGAMRAANDNQPGILHVQISGASGDAHIRTLVQQGVGEGLQQYNKQQERGGFGTLQSRYNSQKG